MMSRSPMESLGERERQAIGRALEALALEVEAVGEGWRLRLSLEGAALEGAARERVSLRVDDGWLLLDAHFDPMSSGSDALSSGGDAWSSGDDAWSSGAYEGCGAGRAYWSMLEANGDLAGGAKLAAVEDAPGAPALRLRGELPLLPGREIHGSLRCLLDGFVQACSRARGGDERVVRQPGGADLEATDPSGVAASATSARLASLCEEGGWTFTPRSDGGGVVDLEVGEGFQQARVSLLAAGGLLISVEPGECVGAAEDCSRAQALFLLRASGWLRMVRAAAELGESGWQPRFETVLAAVPGAAELDEALCALSVACLLCVEELRALGCSCEVARAYLTLQGIDLVATTERSALARRQARKEVRHVGSKYGPAAHGSGRDGAEEGEGLIGAR